MLEELYSQPKKTNFIRKNESATRPTTPRLKVRNEQTLKTENGIFQRNRVKIGQVQSENICLIRQKEGANPIEARVGSMAGAARTACMLFHGARKYHPSVLFRRYVRMGPKGVDMKKKNTAALAGPYSSRKCGKRRNISANARHVEILKVRSCSIPHTGVEFTQHPRQAGWGNPQP